LRRKKVVAGSFFFGGGIILLKKKGKGGKGVFFSAQKGEGKKNTGLGALSFRGRNAPLRRFCGGKKKEVPNNPGKSTQNFFRSPTPDAMRPIRRSVYQGGEKKGNRPIH